MNSRSFTLHHKCGIIFACLYLLTFFIGVICYEKCVFGLSRDTDLMPYAEQVCGKNMHAIEQYDLQGLSLIGLMDENDRYTLAGFTRSPISGRYKSEYAIYDDDQPTEDVLHGVICLFRSKGFYYRFDLYPMTDENNSQLDLSSKPWYPVIIKRNNLDVLKTIIRDVEPSVFALQIIPYAIIGVGLAIVWLLAYVIYFKRQKRKADISA